MNREANTILSKANDLEVSNCGIDLKTEIEKSENRSRILNRGRKNEGRPGYTDSHIRIFRGRKGTVTRKILEQYDNYALSISATTRDPREGEENGREYFFKISRRI